VPWKEKTGKLVVPTVEVWRTVETGDVVISTVIPNFHHFSKGSSQIANLNLGEVSYIFSKADGHYLPLSKSLIALNNKL
jgi:hypothetical protein